MSCLVMTRHTPLYLASAISFHTTSGPTINRIYRTALASLPSLFLVVNVFVLMILQSEHSVGVCPSWFDLASGFIDGRLLVISVCSVPLALKYFSSLLTTPPQVSKRLLYCRSVPSHWAVFYILRLYPLAWCHYA